MNKDNENIILKNLRLAYDLESIANKEFIIPLHKITVIEGVSGKGKTSLLNVLLGISQINGGEVIGGNVTSSAVFQEDRLLEDLDSVKNIKIVQRNLQEKYIEGELEKLLPVSYIKKPLSTYSKGMKRRVAIVRAMLKSSDMVVMDEPLAGLDEKLRKKTADYIMEKLDGRTLVIAVHEKEEAKYFNPQNIITL